MKFPLLLKFRHLILRHKSKFFFHFIFLILTFFLVVSILHQFKNNDNMMDMIQTKRHNSLKYIELSISKKKFVISDKETINYINSNNFKKNRASFDYYCGAFWPIKGVFGFADGSKYNAVVIVPNKRGYIMITYPVNYWSADSLDEPKKFLDLDLVETKQLNDLLEEIGAYK